MLIEWWEAENTFWCTLSFWQLDHEDTGMTHGSYRTPLSWWKGKPLDVVSLSKAKEQTWAKVQDWGRRKSGWGDAVEISSPGFFFLVLFSFFFLILSEAASSKSQICFHVTSCCQWQEQQTFSCVLLDVFWKILPKGCLVSNRGFLQFCTVSFIQRISHRQ